MTQSNWISAAPNGNEGRAESHGAQDAVKENPVLEAGWDGKVPKDQSRLIWRPMPGDSLADANRNRARLKAIARAIHMAVQAAAARIEMDRSCRWHARSKANSTPTSPVKATYGHQ